MGRIAMFTDVFDYIYTWNMSETWKPKQFLMFDGKTMVASFCECEEFFVRLHAMNRFVAPIRRL